MKNLFNLIAIAFLLFATSCQKEEVVEQLPEASQKITANVVGNSESELDQVGKIHNEVLTELMTKSSSYYDPFLIDLEEILMILKDFLEANGGDTNEEVLENMVRHFAEIIERGDAITTATIDICQIFPPACDQVIMPYNPYPINLPTFENPILTADSKVNFKNAVDQIGAIKDFEKTILNDATMEGSDRNFYLAYASTYRHSTQFWYSAGNLDLFDVDKLDKVSRPCFSCDISAADAAGSAVGDSLSGGLMGGVFGAVASFFTFIDKLN